MRRFWNARARENPWYFINRTLDYHEPDVHRFWASGERDVDKILGATGVTLEPDDHVVEVGCGAGRMTRAIARRAARVTAIDVAPRMLELARDHNADVHNVDWVLGDGATLTGVPDASADACISYVVLQHIPDPEVTLGYVREMGRVLKPGGWAAFQFSNDPAVHRPRRHGPRRRWAAFRGRLPSGEADRAWLGSWVELSALRAAAGSGGLDLERVEGEGTLFCLVLARRRG
jgi:SAM-dependent methyltransferase